MSIEMVFEFEMFLTKTTTEPEIELKRVSLKTRMKRLEFQLKNDDCKSNI